MKYIIYYLENTSETPWAINIDKYCILTENRSQNRQMMGLNLFLRLEDNLPDGNCSDSHVAVRDWRRSLPGPKKWLGSFLGPPDWG